MLRIPVAGLVWAAAAPAWTGTQTPAAAVFGHSQSRSLQEKPPTETARALDFNYHHFTGVNGWRIFRFYKSL